MSAQQLNNFANLFRIGLDQEKNTTRESMALSAVDKATILDRLEKTRESFERSLARNALGLIGEEEERSERGGAEEGPKEAKKA